MKVKNVMSSDVITVSQNQTIKEASELMLHHDIGSLIVMNDSYPIGIVTDRDIIKAIAKGTKIEDGIKHATTCDIIMVNESESTEQAVSKMSLHQVRRLAVVNDNQELTGIVSLGDLSTNEMSDQQAGSALSHISSPNSNALKNPESHPNVEDFPL